MMTMNRLTTVVLLLVSLLFVAARAENTSSALRGAVQNPFACSLAAADEDSCTSALDDDGNPCVWCKFAQAGGACVSSEQASEISNVVPQVTCGGPTIDEDDEFAPVKDVPDDVVKCMERKDEDSCNDETCTWCNTMAGFGVCFSQEALEVAKMYKPLFQCDDHKSMIEIAAPWDPTCVMASFTQGADKDSCEATMDQEGNACVWCDGNANTNNMGLCMTYDQSSVASQWLTCDSPSAHDIIQDAMDPSCLVVGYEGGDEDACHSTDDEDGNPCVWCNGPNNVGICLNSNQAAMAGQWLTCDDDSTFLAFEEQEIESPLDPTCIEAGLQGDKDSCEATQDQDGNTCVWCDGGDASTGLCLNAEQASMASQWLTCDDTMSSIVTDNENDEVTSPTDPTCAAAGYQAKDAEATCHSTDDADGNACVWCTGPSPNMGVCLSADQASIVGQWLSCEDDGDEIEALLS